MRLRLIGDALLLAQVGRPGGRASSEAKGRPRSAGRVSAAAMTAPTCSAV